MFQILVIDDEKTILSMIQTILARSGFDVDVASDGQAGIQKFEDGHFDLVVTDVVMPKVDGTDVVKHIRGSGKPHTPIIGMSGTYWLLGNEFDAVLAKPFPLRDLVDTIRYLLSKSGSTPNQTAVTG
jgi:DNA-binding response OmpR family regulator